MVGSGVHDPHNAHSVLQIRFVIQTNSIGINLHSVHHHLLLFAFDRHSPPIPIKKNMKCVMLLFNIVNVSFALLCIPHVLNRE